MRKKRETKRNSNPRMSGLGLRLRQPILYFLGFRTWNKMDLDSITKWMGISLGSTHIQTRLGHVDGIKMRQKSKQYPRANFNFAGVGKPFVLNPNIPKLPLLIFKLLFILNQFFKTKKYKHAEDL